MTIKHITKEKINIEAYSLYDFLVEVAKVARLGYAISDSNEDFPQSYGGYHFVGMNKLPSVSDDDFDYSSVDEVKKLVEEAYNRGKSEASEKQESTSVQTTTAPRKSTRKSPR